MSASILPETSTHEWIRVAEAARILGTDTRTVRRLAETGRLDGFQIGLRGRRQYWRIWADSVTAYQRAGRRADWLRTTGLVAP